MLIKNWHIKEKETVINKPTLHEHAYLWLANNF